METEQIVKIILYVISIILILIIIAYIFWFWNKQKKQKYKKYQNQNENNNQNKKKNENIDYYSDSDINTEDNNDNNDNNNNNDNSDKDSNSNDSNSDNDNNSNNNSDSDSDINTWKRNNKRNDNKGNKNNNIDEITDVTEIGDDNINPNGNNNNEYIKNDDILSLLKINSNIDVNVKDSTLNYEEFKYILFKQEFLNKYLKSLKISWDEKLKIYKKKYNILLYELKNTQKRTGNKNSIPGNHDSNLERLNRATNEIKSIIEILQYKINNMNIERLTKDLNDAIYSKEFGIESLIGRDEVKDILALQIFTFVRNPRLFFNSFQNITIYGQSGVGKSKLAETIGFVYSKSGILARGHVRNVTKQELISPYVNDSTQLTRELLLSTLEGILFIDEAYDLSPPKSILGSGIDHGHEAITEMVNFLDKNMGLSIVIAAGYEDDMEERFFKANQGLDRRFPNKIKLSNYSSKQLTDILLKFIRKSSPELKLNTDEINYIFTLIDFIYSQYSDIFKKQAGDMLILSNVLIRSIYGSVTYYWKSNDIKNNGLMLLQGFNDYLRDRNIALTLK